MDRVCSEDSAVNNDRANSNRPDLIESRWAYHLVPIGLPWLPESIRVPLEFVPVFSSGLVREWTEYVVKIVQTLSKYPTL
jgi:hypothetical protein